MSKPSPESQESGRIARYRAARFVLLPGMLTPDEARALLTSTQDVPRKRVICGIKEISWDEQSFRAPHPAYQLFEGAEPVGLVRRLTGLTTIRRLTCWTSIYGPGQFINPHRDQGGTIQLLVCLQATASRQNGGELVLNGQAFF